MDKEEVTSWNKKRIFIAIFLIVLLVIGGYFYNAKVLNKNSLENKNAVKGVAAKEEPIPSFNIQEAVRERINNLKQEVSGLNIKEVASSSPSVQKVLNDIKSLEQYPTNQVKEICRKICGL